jgi:hypothetical protein
MRWREKKYFAVSLWILILVPACIKVVERNPSPSTTLFVDGSVRKEELWTAVKYVIEDDFHFQLNVFDLEHGNISTQSKTLDTVQPMRAQLFLTIRPTSAGYIISVFQSLQVWDGKAKSWRAVASDQKLENEIIKAIEQKLRPPKIR